MSTSTISSPLLSRTDSMIEALKSSPRLGRGIQNKSSGSNEKNEGDAGLSTLTNAEEEGNDSESGHSGKSLRFAEEEGAEDVAKDDVANSEAGSGSEQDVANSKAGSGSEQDVANSGAGSGSIVLSGLGKEANIFSHLAFNDRIVSSVKGPFTFSAAADVKSKEEHGLSSSGAIGTSSMTLLASGISVKAKFSVQTAGITTVSEPTATSTIWPDGNKTENERFISSFADRLTLTEDAAILSDSLKENKENLKVLCSNSNYFKYSL